MTFRFVSRAPAVPLGCFVEALWYAHGQVPYARERILPNGKPVMIFNLGAPFQVGLGDGEARRYRDAWLIGPAARVTHNRPLAETHVVGVTFRPWGAAALLRLPASALADRVEHAADVWDTGTLRERLAETPDVANRLDLVEAALTAQLAPGDAGLAMAVHAARRLARPGARVEALAAELGISRKHLSTLFRRHVGVAPKAHARLARFNRTLRTLASGDVALDELALAHGYYDQAHFNRDFAAFSGLSPTAYRARRRRFLAPSDDPSGLFVPEGER